jgi:4-amino-4-deoxy-L-arabinose transferase-like glycosyltransferase
MRTTQYRATILFFLSVAAIGFVVYSSFGLSSDEGIGLNAAWQLLSGKKLYIDFIEYVSPGVAYVLFWAWTLIGGASYASARIVSIVFFLISAFGLFRVVRRVSGRDEPARYAVLLWLFSCLSFANHNVWSSYVAIWATLALLYALDRRDAWAALLAGALSGLTFMFLQTKGVALLGAVAVSLLLVSTVPLRARVRHVAIAVAGFVLTTIPLVFVWDWHTLLDRLFLYVFRGEYFSHTLIQPTFVVLELLIVGCMLTVSFLNRRKDFFALTFVQVALFACSANLVDVYHLGYVIFPALALGVAWLDRRISQRIRNRTVPVAHLTLILALTVLFAFFLPRDNALGIRLYRFENSVYRTDAALRDASVFLVDSAVRSARSLYAGPFIPEFYPLLHLPNPFSVSNLLLCGPTCQEATLDVFKREAPDIAFLAYGISDRFGYRRDNPVDAYIQTTYVKCGRLQWGDFYTYTKVPCE